MIEALKPSPSFSKKTAGLMDAGAYIMSISFAEIACKIKMGKLELSISSRDLFQQFSQIEHIEIIDISVNEWLDSIELIWDENRDPADRIITAFAIKNELPIVTTDKKIEKFYRKVIW
jgi:PIN domain nuclease of toxin-antitoxin system